MYIGMQTKFQELNIDLERKYVDLLIQKIFQNGEKYATTVKVAFYRMNLNKFKEIIHGSEHSALCDYVNRDFIVKLINDENSARINNIFQIIDPIVSALKLEDRFGKFQLQ